MSFSTGSPVHELSGCSNANTKTPHVLNARDPNASAWQCPEGGLQFAREHSQCVFRTLELYYYEARNDYINVSETILSCNRFACYWKINSQTINVCNCRVHRNYLLKAPKVHKIIHARKPCVTDVLYNLEISAQKIKVCVIILAP